MEAISVVPGLTYVTMERVTATWTASVGDALNVEKTTALALHLTQQMTAVGIQV